MDHDEIDERMQEAADHADDAFDRDSNKYTDASEAFRWGNVPEEQEENMRDGTAYAKEYLQNVDVSYEHEYVDLIANGTPGCDHHASCINIGPSMIAYARKHPDATLEIRGDTYLFSDGVRLLAQELLPKVNGTRVDAESPYHEGHVHIVFED